MKSKRRSPHKNKKSPQKNRSNKKSSYMKDIKYIESQEDIEKLCNEIYELNSHIKEDIISNAVFNKNNKIKSWNLSSNDIKSLPESFGYLKIEGNLNLSNNELKTLPESFGNITVGGYLDLAHNNFKTLPNSFGNIKLSGSLYLNNNKLEILPDSFGNLQVGKLYLQNNNLKTLFSKIFLLL